MSWFKQLLSGRRATKGGPGAPSPENTEAFPDLEGQLDPNTAALMDGSPPAGVSGRIQPDADPRRASQQRGPSETDTKHLPG
jgi:hypothetical protein